MPPNGVVFAIYHNLNRELLCVLFIGRYPVYIHQDAKGKESTFDIQILESDLRNLFKKPNQLPSLSSIIIDIESYGMIDHPESPESLPSTCVIWGKENQVLPWEAGKVLCEKYVFQETYFIEDAGHLLMREEYAEMNRIMDGFLEKTSFADTTVVQPDSMN